jgi:hypothetical protein
MGMSQRSPSPCTVAPVVVRGFTGREEVYGKYQAR